jgi:hypothetical protein
MAFVQPSSLTRQGGFHIVRDTLLTLDAPLAATAECESGGAGARASDVGLPAWRPLWAPRPLSPRSVHTILHYGKANYAHRFKIAARSNRCTLVARSASASSRSQAARPSPLPLVASRLDRGFRARVVATG